MIFRMPRLLGDDGTERTSSQIQLIIIIHLLPSGLRDRALRL